MKDDNLKRIHDDYQRDRAFRTLRKEATQFVPGKGSSSSPFLIFIGEAPGHNEDLQGEPFVGAAGKVLDKLLERNELERRMVWITNVVKYRPPNNRTPSTEEIDAARPYLRRELKVVAKKRKVGGNKVFTRPLICLLGKTATLLLGNELAKPQHRGTIIERPGLWRFAPLYHPAVALYDPQMLPILHQHMKAVVNEEVKVKK